MEACAQLVLHALYARDDPLLLSRPGRRRRGMDSPESDDRDLKCRLRLRLAYGGFDVLKLKSYETSMDSDFFDICRIDSLFECGRAALYLLHPVHSCHEQHPARQRYMEKDRAEVEPDFVAGVPVGSLLGGYSTPRRPWPRKSAPDV